MSKIICTRVTCTALLGEDCMCALDRIASLEKELEQTKSNWNAASKALDNATQNLIAQKDRLTESEDIVTNLATLIRRLCASLNVADPGQLKYRVLQKQARRYLEKVGHEGNLLRLPPAPQEGK